MVLHLRNSIYFADGPEGFMTTCLPGGPFDVERDLLMKIDVMRELKNLLDMAFAFPCFFGDLSDEAAHNKEHVAIEARDRIVEYYNAVAADARFRVASLEKVIEVEKRDKAGFALAESKLSVLAV